MQVEPCVNSQNYSNICRRVRRGEGGGSDLITLLSWEGREVTIDLTHAPWPPLTHHSTAGELIQQRKEGLHQILYCVHTYVW
jgi:hypothetical protein